MRINNVFSKSLVAGALVATSFSLAGPAAATPLIKAAIGGHGSAPQSVRPLSPPKGGTQLITYYSDATHTTVVGQRTSTPCQSAWGVMTSYYVVTPVPC